MFCVLFSDCRADGPVWWYVHSTWHSLSYGNDPTVYIFAIDLLLRFKWIISFKNLELEWANNLIHVARFLVSSLDIEHTLFLFLFIYFIFFELLCPYLPLRLTSIPNASIRPHLSFKGLKHLDWLLFMTKANTPLLMLLGKSHWPVDGTQTQEIGKRTLQLHTVTGVWDPSHGN